MLWNKRIVVVFLTWVIVEAETPNEWSPEVSIRMKSISQLAFSPSGDAIAFSVREAVTQGEKSEYLNQIWVVKLSKRKSPIQYTFGEKSSSRPQFSPDGEYIAFARNVDEKTQVWIMRTAGGEAWQFSYQKESVSDFRWSPDGKQIAIVMKDPKSEEEETEEKEKRDVILVDKNFKNNHIYIKAFTSKIDTAEANKITSGNFTVNALNWSPDSRKIVFSHSEEPTFNSRSITGDVSIVTVAEESIKTLVDWPGVDADPIFSPDGRIVAFSSDGGTTERIGLGDCFVVQAKGGKPKKLAETPNRSVGVRGAPGILQWSNDGKHVYTSDYEGTRTQIYRLDVKGKKISGLTSYDGVISNPILSPDEKQIAFVGQSTEKPSELYVSDLQKFSPKALSSFNRGMEWPDITNTERLNWESKDGLAIEGLLTYPSGYEKGKQYPLALIIHGGPAGVFTETFTGSPSIYVIQYFAEKGYAVLRPNPRGSTGYGKEFRYANFKDWGFGDYEDIMSGVDKVIEMGVADPERMAAMGWSYGGYMTSFLVTRTGRFKAASMGAGLPNLVSMVTTTDIPDYLTAHMGAEFWEDYETYEKHSAIYRVGNVTTPTQVIHGSNDLRVPFTQGQEFYVALKRRGIETEMIVYPRTPHGPREPKLLMDVSPRILAWLDNYIAR
ncbi:MAG: S9 family peptidase [Candidatus Neomarinimicrobiota bacterium]|nr:S9 family peptidase [Candidatus Neomarinimicrobiota bacterium]